MQRFRHQLLAGAALTLDQHVDRAAADLVDQADDGLSSMAHADNVLGRKAAFGILTVFPGRYGVFGFYEFTELGSFEGVGGMGCQRFEDFRSEEHTSELQSHHDL